MCAEDCIFSRRVIPQSPESLVSLYAEMIEEVRSSRSVGDQIVAQNMAFNFDMRAFYAYSFEIAEQSDPGVLLQEFLSLSLPRLFLYGERNKKSSYLPHLRSSAIEVTAIPSVGRFLYYDNPMVIYGALGTFVHSWIGVCWLTRYSRRSIVERTCNRRRAHTPTPAHSQVFA